MTTIDAPRTPTRPQRSKGVNLERTAWVFMRASGIVLVALIFGHLIVNLMLGEGIEAVDFGFVAGKYADPFWQIWDALMLWLALIHGSNGMRTLVNDYVHSPRVNRALKVALFVVAAILIILGTLVIFTFDPCLGETPQALIANGTCPA